MRHVLSQKEIDQFGWLDFIYVRLILLSSMATSVATSSATSALLYMPRKKWVVAGLVAPRMVTATGRM